MLKKIRLFHQIQKFYQIFGEEVGDNFITKLSDITSNNLNDVLFDINEVYYEDANPMTAWLDKLRTKIYNYLEKPKFPTADFVVLLAVFALVVGFIVTAEMPQKKVVETPKVHTRYTAYGRYYTKGTVVADDGNKWDYTTDIISDKTPTDNMPVWIGLDDNGTPNDTTDDIVLGLVYDVYTAIYDALETELSKEFELERDGNNIQIGGSKQ